MTNTEVIRDKILEILGVEHHLLQSIERQTRDSRIKGYRSAHELLLKTEFAVSSHVVALERHLADANGGYEAKLKKAATSFMGAVGGLYDKVRQDEPVSRNLRDDYAELNLAAISYGMLHTVALALHDSAIAEMAYRHLTELTPLIIQLSDLIPLVLTEELSNEGKIEDTSTARQALANLQTAWSHETVRT